MIPSTVRQAHHRQGQDLRLRFEGGEVVLLGICSDGGGQGLFLSVAVEEAYEPQV